MSPGSNLVRASRNVCPSRRQVAADVRTKLGVEKAMIIVFFRSITLAINEAFNRRLFSLGVISQSGKPGWEDELRECLETPPSRQNAARRSATANQNVNIKTSKEDKNPREERRKTQARNELQTETWRSRRNRTTTISQNNRMSLQTKFKKTNTQ
jgi:hypothetical protein